MPLTNSTLIGVIVVRGKTTMATPSRLDATSAEPALGLQTATTTLFHRDRIRFHRVEQLTAHANVSKRTF